VEVALKVLTPGLLLVWGLSELLVTNCLDLGSCCLGMVTMVAMSIFFPEMEDPRDYIAFNAAYLFYGPEYPEKIYRVLELTLIEEGPF
jgi:hypothetical protein